MATKILGRWVARPHYFFILLFALLLASFYFQYGLGLTPCPLCLIQRYIVVALFLAYGVLVFWRTIPFKFAISMKTAIFLFASFGVMVAGRQVWLQSLPPDQVVGCVPSLGAMLDYLPLKEMVKQLYLGGSDCAKVEWRFLGFSMAAWMVAWFAFFALMSGWDVLRWLKNRKDLQQC